MNPRIHIVAERCKGCCLCIAVCQAGVLDKSTETNSLGYLVPVVKELAQCINCGMCEMICPEFGIWVSMENEVEV